MRKIYNTFRLIRAIFKINQFNNVNSTYHRNARKLIKEYTVFFTTGNDEILPPPLLKKMQWYMAEFIFACEFFNEVLKQKSNDHQKKLYLLSGALIAICDMLVDDLDSDMERLELIKKPGKDFKAISDLEQLYLSIYSDFILLLDEETRDRSLYFYETLFDAQIESKRQLNPDLTKEETDKICKEKCAMTLLLIRAMVNGEISKIEEQALYELGGFIQYCNDAQDLYKDAKQNIRTSATARPDLESIAQNIDQQRVKSFSLIQQVDYYSDKAKDDLLFICYAMFIGILSKLNVISQKCDRDFSYEKVRSKSKEEMRIRAVTFQSFKFSFLKIIGYEYGKVGDFQTFTFKS